MKRVIVTGATSLIGIALLALLRERGISAAAIVRPDSTRGALLRGLYPELQIWECSLEELDKAVLSADTYDALFHIGWSSDFPDSRYNLEGQMQNVEYCLKAVRLADRYQCGSFLCVGSQAECGRVLAPLDSATPPHPETAYAQAKCVAYEKTADLCRRYGIRQYWPRLLSTYGPFDRESTLIMSCIRACREGTCPELTRAEQIWDYIYVRDAAEALLAVLEYGVPEKRYAIASGKGKKLKEYIAEIAREADYQRLLEGIGRKDYAAGQVMYLTGNIGELTADTGFLPKWDFTRGIRETLKSYDKAGRRRQGNEVGRSGI